jgi:hypothetical protein
MKPVPRSVNLALAGLFKHPLKPTAPSTLLKSLSTLACSRIQMLYHGMRRADGLRWQIGMLRSIARAFGSAISLLSVAPYSHRLSEDTKTICNAGESRST